MLTTTNTLLLDQLNDPQHAEAWNEFDGRYRPVLVAFARRLQLSDVDAEEAAQATLARFVEYYRKGHYDRSRGRLRNWIFAIAENCVRDQYRGRSRRRESRGESVLLQLEGDQNELQNLWNSEWQKAVTRTALEELRTTTRTDPQTMRAFEMLALEEKPAQEVADELGMSRSAVYVAKHRAIQRLRAILARLEETF